MDTMVIEVPIATPESHLIEIIKGNFLACGFTYTVFDTFRIPSRDNRMDAYKIIIYR
jgi:hypothetical protein